MAEISKVCKLCGVDKPLTEYYQNTTSKKIGATLARCKVCCCKADMVRHHQRQERRKRMGIFHKSEEHLKALCAECKRDLGSSKHLKCQQCRKSLTCISCKAKFEDSSRRFSMCKKCRPKERVCLN